MSHCRGIAPDRTDIEGEVAGNSLDPPSVCVGIDPDRGTGSSERDLDLDHGPSQAGSDAISTAEPRVHIASREPASKVKERGLPFALKADVETVGVLGSDGDHRRSLGLGMAASNGSVRFAGPSESRSA